MIKVLWNENSQTYLKFSKEVYKYDYNHLHRRVDWSSFTPLSDKNIQRHGKIAQALRFSMLSPSERA